MRVVASNIGQPTGLYTKGALLEKQARIVFSGSTLKKLQVEAATEYQKQMAEKRAEALEKEFFNINGTSFTGRMVLEAIQEACDQPSYKPHGLLYRLFTGKPLPRGSVWMDRFNRMGAGRENDLNYAVWTLHEAGLVDISLKFFKGEFLMKMTPDGKRAVAEGAQRSEAEPVPDKKDEPIIN